MSKPFSEWMIRWETALTSRDTNRIVRPFECGLDYLGSVQAHVDVEASDLNHVIAANAEIVRTSEKFFSYSTPTDFRLENRYPEIFPTNYRLEARAQESLWEDRSEAEELEHGSFLRFTSPIVTTYSQNNLVNARWYPARLDTSARGQAVIVMPQWNADAFSHNALCKLFNNFGISCLRLSKPYHDVRRPGELERSDFAVSANVGRTLGACRQAVVDIRSCLDWLSLQGYNQFGILGTSLGSCYAFIAAAHDQRLQVCAFNHASTWFGDVIWTGQSTRHIRAALEKAGLSQSQVRSAFLGVSPMAYMDRFAASPRRSLVVYAKYDLTFLRQFSLELLAEFDRRHIDYVSKVLPCGHYTTGEFPFKYLDGWYLGSFVRESFKQLARKNPL